MPQQAILVASIALAVVLGIFSHNKKEHVALSLIALNALVGFSRQRGSYYFYVGQPVLVLLVFFFLVQKYDLACKFLIGLYVIVTTCITAAFDPCSPSTWMYVPDALAVLYLIAGVAHFYDALYPAWSLAEAGLLAVFLARADKSEIVLRAEHLTWWSLMLFGLWDAIIFVEYYVNVNYATKKIKLVSQLTPTVLLVNIIVLLGVFYMSALSCNLLIDAHNEAGTYMYILGNFAMHYYPLLRTMFTPMMHSSAALAKGGAIVVLYSISYPATEVYGCSDPPPAYIPVVLGGAAIVVSIVFELAWVASTKQLLWQFNR
ncbi:MAG: hypothetical protein CL678_17505 [Bdellovibrionaceae bacterium]|nr:hypothetical protein [Pseudobdellovibrionaceae bacterium]